MFPRIGVVLLVPALWLAGSATRAQKPSGVPEGSGPRIEAATPVVARTEGATVCVCGAFPDQAALEGLRIDGRPVEASVDAFGRVATLRLPPGLAPGSHALTGSPEAGFGPEDRAELRLIQINTKTCEPLPFGPRRRVHVMIAGTEDPVKLRVRNETPALVTLAGGSAFELTTSGGRRNQAIINAKVTGLAGRWLPTVELASPPCPCAGGAERGIPPERVAGGAEPGIPPERVAELEAYLQVAVAEIEAWFDGRARELAARAERGVLTPGEVIALINELERRLLRVLATPDLAALRAWVEDELARERERWRRAPAGPVPAAARSASGFVIAAGVSPRAAPPILRAQAEASHSFGAFRAWTSEFFGDLWNVSNDLVVDLCVQSVPTGPKVWLYPKRYLAGAITPQSTDTEILNLSRGIYLGGIEDVGPSTHFEVDLVRRFRVYVRCNLDTSPECRDRDRPTTEFECVGNGDE